MDEVKNLPHLRVIVNQWNKKKRRRRKKVVLSRDMRHNLYLELLEKMFLSFPLAKESGGSECIQLTDTKCSPGEHSLPLKATQLKHKEGTSPQLSPTDRSVPLSFRRHSFNQHIMTMTNCSAADSHTGNYKTMAKQSVGLKFISVFNLLKPTF